MISGAASRAASPTTVNPSTGFCSPKTVDDMRLSSEVTLVGPAAERLWRENRATHFPLAMVIQSQAKTFWPKLAGLYPALARNGVAPESPACVGCVEHK